MKHKPLEAGISSFDLIDQKKLLGEPELRADEVFLDLACGTGSYAIAAATNIGPTGKIYGIDLWQAGIETLKCEVADRGIHHIYGKLAVLGQAIPLEDAAVDVCFIATALHDLVWEMIKDR